LQHDLPGRHLGDSGELPAERRGEEQRRNLRKFLPALAVFALLVALVAFGVIPVDALQLANVAGIVMIALAVLFFGSVLLLPGLTREEKKNVAVILLLFLSSTVFWAGYEQAGSTLNLFARDYTDRSLFGAGFATGMHPASWYQAVPPIFVILLAPLFAWLWIALNRRGRDPSAIAKLGLGLLTEGARRVLSDKSLQRVRVLLVDCLPFELFRLFARLLRELARRVLVCKGVQGAGVT